MRSLLSFVLLMVVGIAGAENGEAAKPPADVRAAVEAFVRDMEGLRQQAIAGIVYGSALGGKRTDMLVVDLEVPAKPEPQPHRLGTRLWLEQDDAGPHGYRLLDEARTIDGTTLRNDISVEAYEAIIMALHAEMPKAPVPVELGDEDFGAPALPSLGFPVRYFGLNRAPSSHVQQWLYFGEVDGVVQLVATIKIIAIE